jgi:hypothetical protein
MLKRFLDPATLTLSRPQSAGELTVLPLLRPGTAEPGYLTLGEALARGLTRVTEVSEGGSVPQLLFINDAMRPVLLLDGEELVGAKQNRVLNLTVLAPAPPRPRSRCPASSRAAGTGGRGSSGTRTAPSSPPPAPPRWRR